MLSGMGGVVEDVHLGHGAQFEGVGELDVQRQDQAAFNKVVAEPTRVGGKLDVRQQPECYRSFIISDEIDLEAEERVAEAVTLVADMRDVVRVALPLKAGQDHVYFSVVQQSDSKIRI